MSLLIRPADEIKLIVIDYLIRKYPEIIIGNEVMYGTAKKVVDLLALYKGQTYAIELKSEKDDIRRLHDQLKEYARIFDYIIVVTHPKHTAEIVSLSKAKVSILEIHNEEIVVKTPLKRNKPLKSEMIHSIKTSYLKRFLPLSKTGEIANNIRSQITRKYKVDDIHQMLYGFLKLKLEERFTLYLKERGEKNYDDLTLLSAQLNLGSV